MNMDAPALVIYGLIYGGDNAQLSLTALRRERSGDTNAYDSDWIVTRCQVAAPGFQADVTESVLLSELVGLRDDLAKMYAELEGRMKWSAREHFLTLTAERNRLGHIYWTIELNQPMGMAVRLRLEIRSDQTYLPPLLDQIDAILEAFPLVGKPKF